MANDCVQSITEHGEAVFHLTLSCCCEAYGHAYVQCLSRECGVVLTSQSASISWLPFMQPGVQTSV